MVPSSSARDVLALMAQGRSNQSIATPLYVSEKTVKVCSSRIFAKLVLRARPDDHRRVQAVLTYLRGREI
jgi:DNA-binding NarL/FixJ family response regulator